MKKMLIYILVLFLALISITAAAMTINKKNSSNIVSEEPHSTEKTFEEAKKLNDNSNLGVKYLESCGLSEERLKEYNDDMPGGTTTSDGFVNGWYFPYPREDTSDRLLTQIKVTGGTYDIFGIKLGDNISYAADILYKYSYKKNKSENDHIDEEKYNTYYQNEDIIIVLQTNDKEDTITSISILTDIK